MRKKLGFTLVEIMIVVAIIGLLAAIAIPSFIKARTTSQKNACINNLRQVDGAKEQWAMGENQPATATPSATDINDYIKGGTAKCICPGDPTTSFATSYTVMPLGTDPKCIAVGSPHTLQ
ncbi:MAG: prepilin-type N-terminal cleavage/methylation domain-containing protein [Kiritimatiellae bacterium]|nr:prepilin-type N-terminal cleavage/methylation domain-containing protein [Kiritimatiellia bacterium]